MTDIDLFRKFITSSAIIFAGNVLGIGSLFLTRLLTARHLNPSTYGLLVLGIAILNVVALISLLGLPRGLSQRLPREEKKSVLIQSSLGPPLVISIAMSAVLILGSDHLARFINEPGFDVVLSLLVIATPFFVLAQLVKGIFRGFEDSIGKVATENFLIQGLVLVFVGVAIMFGSGVVGLSIAWAFALIIAALGSLMLLFKRIECLSVRDFVTPHPFHHRSVIRDLLSFSLPLMISGLTARIINQADNLLIGYFLTSDAVGIYDVAFILGTALQLPSTAFAFLLLPVLSDLHSKGERERIDRIYKFTTKWIVLLTLPVYLLFVTHSTAVITFLFGAEYGNRSSLVLVLVASGFFSNLLLGLNGNALIAVDRPRIVMVSNFVSLLLNIILNVLLIPLYGITGAAAASFTTILAVNSLRSYYLFRKTRIHPIYRGWVVPAVAGGFLMVLSNISFQPYLENPIAAILLFGCIQLVLILLFGGVEAEEHELAERYLLKRFRQW